MYLEKIEISKAILVQRKPFKISELVNRLHKRGITNHWLILHELNELVEHGLVKYSQIKENVWAYYVV